MESIINDKLKKINNLEERRFLKDIVSNGILELSEYQNKINKSVEDRVFSEIKRNEGDYDIYFTINEKKDVDLLDEFLFPMNYKDLDEVNLELVDFNNKELVLSRIFIKSSFENIESMLKSSSIFRGIITTNIGSYNISVKLKKNTKYLDKIEKLYEAYIINNIRWRTVNLAYINKFFDVVLVDWEEITENEIITDVEIFYEEYKEYIIQDIIPLWNVKQEMISCSTFPVPTIDKINYEHVIVLPENETSIGYLVNEISEEISYIRHSNNEICIISSEEKAKVWNILKIVQPIKVKKDMYSYDIISNSMKDSFMNYYLLQTGSRIRTKGEVKRLGNSFDMSSFINVVDVVLDDNYEGIKIGYDMNWFIIDSFKSNANKQVMVIMFNVLWENNYLVDDHISFIVTNIQMYFPEYQCVGKLI